MSGRSKSWWGGMAVALVVIALLSVPWMALAQGDLSETYEDNEMAFMYPADWILTANSSGLTELSNSQAALDAGAVADGEVIMDFFTPEFLESVTHAETLEDVLQGFVDVIKLEGVSDPVEVEIGERTGLQVEFEFEGQTAVAVALPFSDGAIGLVTYVWGGELDETVAAVLETLDRPGAAAAAGTGEPCEVSTAVQWGAVLRVGPGENRTELTTLAVNKWFPVTGQAEADDGSLWWQLDKDAVAPGSAAAELWVSQEQVDVRGDCARVGEADAPPIIPMAVAPPPAPPAAGQPAAPAAAPRTGQGVWIDFPEWNNQLPAGMKASSRAAARVAIQVVPTLQTEGQETYVKWDGSTTQVYRNRVVYRLSAVDPRTNAVIAAYDVRGGDPPGFPSTMPINATLNGTPPTLGDAMGWIQGLLG